MSCSVWFWDNTCGVALAEIGDARREDRRGLWLGRCSGLPPSRTCQRIGEPSMVDVRRAGRSAVHQGKQPAGKGPLDRRRPVSPPGPLLRLQPHFCLLSSPLAESVGLGRGPKSLSHVPWKQIGLVISFPGSEGNRYFAGLGPS